MKKFIATLAIFIGLFLGIEAQAPYLNSVTSSITDYLNVGSVKLPGSEMIIYGRTGDPANAGVISPTGDASTFFKVNAFGQMIWEKKIDNNGETFATNEISQFGNFLIISGFTYIGGMPYGTIIKTDLDLNVLFAKQCELPFSYFHSSISDGNFIYSNGHANNGDYNMLISKFNFNTGNTVWSKMLSTPVNDWTNRKGLMFDNQGNLILGTIRWDGTNGLHDIGLAKIDVNGNFIMGMDIGSFGNDSYRNLFKDAAGNIYLFGGCDGTYGPPNNSKTFLTKLDSSLNVIYSKKYDFSIGDPEIGYAAFLASDGFIYTSTTKVLTAPYNIFYSKIDPSTGNIVWARSILGSNSLGYITGFEETVNGELFLTGSSEAISPTGNYATFYGNMDFNGTYSGNVCNDNIYTNYTVSDVVFSGTFNVVSSDFNWSNITLIPEVFCEVPLPTGCPIAQIGLGSISTQVIGCDIDTTFIANDPCDTCLNFYDMSTNTPTSWTWIFSNGYSTSSQTPPNICFQSDSLYEVTLIVSNLFGSDTTVLSIQTPPTAPPDLGNDIVLCAGDSVEIGVAMDSAYLYTWNTGSQSNEIWVNQSGDYILNLTSSLGCVLTDTLAVTQDSISLNLGNDITLCNGDSVLIGTSMNNQLNYIWNTGNNSNNMYVNSQGMYILSIESTNHCFISDTLSIYTDSIEIALGNDTLICGANSLEIGMLLNPNLNYSWNTGAVSNEILVEETGNYILQVTSPQGCSDADSIYVDFGNLVEVDLVADTLHICEFPYTLSPVITPATGTYLYQWNGIPSTQSTFDISTPGWYVFSVTGLCNTANDSIYISENSFTNGYMPNAFTPNNDGLNDVYLIPGLTTMQEMRVFDRWGVELFSSDKPDASWNGEHLNKMVPEGVYYCMIRYENCEGNHETQATFITVLR